MTPRNQRRKDAQDEARRQQQADERVRELEKRVEHLREALSQIAYNRNPADNPKEIAQRALDGGGDTSHDS
jgi:TolA-binding protein